MPLRLDRCCFSPPATYSAADARAAASMTNLIKRASRDRQVIAKLALSLREQKRMLSEVGA